MMISQFNKYNRFVDYKKANKKTASN